MLYRETKTTTSCLIIIPYYIVIAIQQAISSLKYLGIQILMKMQNKLWFKQKLTQFSISL